jgi:hypothetical protein
LDFEADIESLHAGYMLRKDISDLRKCLLQLKCLTPIEEDVQRIERATVILLRELERPLREMRGHRKLTIPLQ